jgi:hypothetical protein
MPDRGEHDCPECAAPLCEHAWGSGERQVLLTELRTWRDRALAAETQRQAVLDLLGHADQATALTKPPQPRNPYRSVDRG